MRTEATTFLSAKQERARVTGWLVKSGSDWVSAGDFVEGWDAATDLQVGAELEIDFAGLVGDCALSETANVQAIATWHSTGTALYGAGPPVRLSILHDDTPIRIQAPVGPGRSSRTLQIGATIVLAARDGNSRALAPATPGMILWSDSSSVRLEGLAARFPIEWADFDSNALPGHAGWYLDWDHRDPEALLLGSVRLLLNSDHGAVTEAIQAGPDDPLAAALKEAIRLDLVRQLCVGMIDCDGFNTDSQDSDDGTVGSAVRNMIELLFPGVGTVPLGEMIGNTPARFEAELQSRLRAFEPDKTR